MKNTVLHLSVLIHLSTCRDFYIGAYKKNDLLMSQDTLYKERLPFRVTTASYGKIYNCPITYVRVVDRLNIGRGPIVRIIRGGLRKKYIVLRLTSTYNNPISVKIYVGCQNKRFTNPWIIKRPTKETTVASIEEITYKPEDQTTTALDGDTTIALEENNTTIIDVAPTSTTETTSTSVTTPTTTTVAA